MRLALFSEQYMIHNINFCAADQVDVVWDIL